MIIDYEPGDKVINPANKSWGIGQVQSIIKEKVTVNFENVGKKVNNSRNIIYSDSSENFNLKVNEKVKTIQADMEILLKKNNLL